MRTPAFFFLFSFSMYCFPSLAQEIKDPAQLLRDLEHARGVERAAIYYQLVLANLGNDKAKALDFGEKALAEAREAKNDSMQIEALTILAMACQHHGEDREGL